MVNIINMLELEMPEEFCGYSPFFKKCVKLSHKIARKAGFIKSKIDLSDIEYIEKKSVITIFRSEQIRKEHKNSHEECLMSMLNISLYMGYGAADQWNNAAEEVDFDSCFEDVYEGRIIEYIIDKYGKCFVDVQREINLKIIKTIQNEKNKSFTDIPFALEAVFQLGVTMALNINYPSDVFLDDDIQIESAKDYAIWKK